MSLGNAKTAIKSYIAAGFSAVPITWENEPFILTGMPSAFIRVEIAGVVNNLVTNGSPGSNLFIHQGVIFIYCFTESGIGFSAGDVLADQLSVLLQRKEIPAPTSPQIVRTEDPSVHGGAPDVQSGNYYRTDVVVPFGFYYLA